MDGVYTRQMYIKFKLMSQLKYQILRLNSRSIDIRFVCNGTPQCSVYDDYNSDAQKAHMDGI